MAINLGPSVPSTPRSGATNMNRRYALTRAEVNAFLTELNSQTFIDNVALLFQNPIDNVISLYAYPFDVKALTTAWSTPADGPIIVNIITMTSVGCDMANIPAPLIDAGTIQILRYFDNFMDYAPYTKLEIFLPYIGFELLDVDVVMGKSIHVQYAIDFYTGKCTAFVSVVDGTDEYIVMIRDGQIGMPVQIAGGSGAELSRSMLKAGIGAAAGLASVANAASGGVKAGVAQSAGYLAGTTTSAIDAAHIHVHKGGTTAALNSFYVPQKCFIIRTTPVDVEPTSYAHNVGYPSGKTATLSALTGYTVVDTVHVEGVGFANATEAERSEVEKILKTGVIL